MSLLPNYTHTCGTPLGAAGIYKCLHEVRQIHFQFPLLGFSIDAKPPLLLLRLSVLLCVYVRAAPTEMLFMKFDMRNVIKICRKFEISLKTVKFI